MRNIVFKDDKITIYENEEGKGLDLGFKENTFSTLFEAICYASSVYDMTSWQKDNKAQAAKACSVNDQTPRHSKE